MAGPHIRTSSSTQADSSAQQGFGTGDTPYNRTSPHPHPENTTGAIPQNPDDAFRQAEHLLQVEKGQRELSLAYVSRLYSETVDRVEVLMTDMVEGTSVWQTQGTAEINRHTQNLQLAHQIAESLTRNPRYAARAQGLLAAIERAQGINQIEECLRGNLPFLSIFLSRNSWETMRPVVSFLSSIASSGGHGMGVLFGLRQSQNLALSLLSSSANALFQVGYSLWQQEQQGQHSTRKQIAGEVGEALLASAACTLLSHGAMQLEDKGLVTKSSRWIIREALWPGLKFFSDVGMEYTLNSLGFIKSALGLEVDGFGDVLTGITANALDEVFGDMAGHPSHRITHRLDAWAQNIWDRNYILKKKGFLVEIWLLHYFPMASRN